MKRAVVAVASAWSVACSPTGRTCVAPMSSGDVVITEVFGDPAGSGDPAWFELFDVTARALDLDGVVLAHDRIGVETEHTHVITGLTIGPGAYAVLGAVAAEATPAYVDYGFGSDLGDLREGGSGTIELRCGDDVVSQVAYADLVAGHSRELAEGVTPTASACAEPSAWCQGDETEFALGEFGTPGGRGDCVVLVPGQCQDGGSARMAHGPGSGALTITEVMAHPDGEKTTREWFEVENTGSSAFDLAGLQLARPDDSKPPDVVAGAACKPVVPGGFALFASSTDPAANGGLPAVDATFGFTLLDSDGSAEVLASDGSVLATVAWRSTSAGVSMQLDPAGSAWCAGSTPYGDGSNLGTPRAPNLPCGP